MAKGSVSVAVEAIEAKKRGLAESGDRQRKLYFRLKDGESAVVRFLEEGDDLHWAWVHAVPATGNQKFPTKVLCRDQGASGEPIGEPCPGCERGDKRTFQGVINLIWRTAPVFERDESNRLVRDAYNKAVITGTEPAVALWIAGVTVFEDLEELDTTFGGLSSRDFLVKRRGAELNTRYTISPADPDGGKQPLDKADKTLAESKYDLTEYVAPPPYNQWGVTNPQEMQQPTNGLNRSPLSRTRT